MKGEQSEIHIVLRLSGCLVRLHIAGQALSCGDSGGRRGGRTGVITSSCQSTDRLQPHGVSRQHGSGASPSVSIPIFPGIVDNKCRIREDCVFEYTHQTSYNVSVCILACGKIDFFICIYHVQ